MANDRRRSSLAGLTSKTKPVVDITLNGEHAAGGVPSFTTLDKIEGAVSITAPTDLPFDALHISFQGSTRTYVEKIVASTAANSRSEAFHNFLRLVQPLCPSDLPPNHILQSGKTYKIPFTFVVPERLLPQTCTHAKDTERVLDAHLALPPSLGDPMVSRDGKTLLNDLAPDMTVISYAIRVILLRRNPEPRGKPVIIVDSVKKLRIIPASDEAPPIPQSNTKGDEYVMRKEKDLKKSIFGRKLGRITMEAAQPRSLHLPCVHTDLSQTRVTTVAFINLRFDPFDASSKPPRLGNLASKLKAATCFASVPMRDFPTKSNAYLYDTQRGIYVDTIPLSCRNIESAQWTPHTVLERHDSAISISDPPPASSTSPMYYTCQVLVPIDLPTISKTFVPSFHSCLVSRIYSLDLTLSVHPPSSTVSSTSLHLKLPLQISVEGNPDAHPTISEEEMHAIAARQVNEALIPRSIAPPSPEYTEVAELQTFLRSSSPARPPLRTNSMPPSPDYEEHAPVLRTGSMGSPLAEPLSSIEASSSVAPPDYSAAGLGTGIRASWGGERGVRATWGVTGVRLQGGLIVRPRTVVGSGSGLGEGRPRELPGYHVPL
ncbi:hypothetical protein MMC30_004184 [Trapelia coarctata]|nr:hypothetical protein [Trapelia coarctata]